MEKKLEIKAHDGKIIDAWFNSENGKSEALIIFVHGLSGSPTEHHYIRAPHFFNPKGFDTVRFSQYANGDSRRIVSEVGVPTHAKDLNSVVKYYHDDYKKIYLVGHSLGAPVILESDLSNIERIVLWDPTAGTKSIEAAVEKSCRFDERIGKYVRLSSGKEILLGQEMIDSWIEASNLDKYTKLIKKPCKLIFAGEENKKNDWRPHLKDISVEWDEVEIEGATHVFVEEGKLEQLYKETLSWLK